MRGLAELAAAVEEIIRHLLHGDDEPDEPELPRKQGPDPALPGDAPTPSVPVIPSASTSGSGGPQSPTLPAQRENATPSAGSKPGITGGLTLDFIKVPDDLILEARGENAAKQEDFYAEEVRKALNFEATPRTYQKGDGVPDG